MPDQNPTLLSTEISDQINYVFDFAPSTYAVRSLGSIGLPSDGPRMEFIGSTDAVDAFGTRITRRGLEKIANSFGVRDSTFIDHGRGLNPNMVYGFDTLLGKITEQPEVRDHIDPTRMPGLDHPQGQVSGLVLTTDIDETNPSAVRVHSLAARNYKVGASIGMDIKENDITPIYDKRGNLTHLDIEPTALEYSATLIPATPGCLTLAARSRSFLERRGVLTEDERDEEHAVKHWQELPPLDAVMVRSIAETAAMHALLGGRRLDSLSLKEIDTLRAQAKEVAAKPSLYTAPVKKETPVRTARDSATVKDEDGNEISVDSELEEQEQQEEVWDRQGGIWDVFYAFMSACEELDKREDNGGDKATLDEYKTLITQMADAVESVYEKSGEFRSITRQAVKFQKEVLHRMTKPEKTEQEVGKHPDTQRSADAGKETGTEQPAVAALTPEQIRELVREEVAARSTALEVENRAQEPSGDERSLAAQREAVQTEIRSLTEKRDALAAEHRSLSEKHEALKAEYDALKATEKPRPQDTREYVSPDGRSAASDNTVDELLRSYMDRVPKAD